ncbi:MAG: ATP-dependent DNA helicase RecG [Oligoflexia bacterium]|nr:ATP-dependent DNA helicase RecG [Oligoflexia bacterium]
MSTNNKKILLDSPIQYMKGVGPKRAQEFQRKGIQSLEDALYYFPLRYEDRTRICGPKDLYKVEEGTSISVLATIQSVREIPLKGKKSRLIELVAIGDDGGLLSCTWFQSYKGLKEKLEIGKKFIFQGKLKKFRGAPQIIHPEFELQTASTSKKQKKSIHWGRVVPIYSRSEILSQKFIRETLFHCLEIAVPQLNDLLPDQVREKHQLISIQDAFKEIHFPSNYFAIDQISSNNLPPAYRRFIFEEFFKFQLILKMDRTKIKKLPAQSFSGKNELFELIKAQLPFELTQGQKQAIEEIRKDVAEPIAMNRIVQGDVGSGKTLVAILSACNILDQNAQVALMAPTEILAEQHYRLVQSLFENSSIRVALLTGSLPKKEKEKIQLGIREGHYHFVVGTHALIQASVQWNNLGLVIIDEQHRFGVNQRTQFLAQPGSNLSPHMVTMTATPIPRSLALTVFGELQVSTITELPAGRSPIKTKVIAGSERNKLYNLIKKEVSTGRQAYLVYPLVSESESEGFEHLKSVEKEFVRLKNGPLAELNIAFVHGKLPNEERLKIMNEFKEGKVHVLLSTTVIEVGVDVPNATVMGIENAERFGLSQLHQLRGRIGRGKHQGYCVLVTDSKPPSTSQANFDLEEGVEEESPWVRLQKLEISTSGFEISEFDLKLRGPGDFFGTKQSGSPTFRLADLVRDIDLLENARNAADLILQDDPNLSNAEHTNLKKWSSKVLEAASKNLKSG